MNTLRLHKAFYDDSQDELVKAQDALSRAFDLAEIYRCEVTIIDETEANIERQNWRFPEHYNPPVLTTVWWDDRHDCVEWEHAR